MPDRKAPNDFLNLQQVQNVIQQVWQMGGNDGVGMPGNPPKPDLLTKNAAGMPVVRTIQNEIDGKHDKDIPFASYLDNIDRAKANYLIAHNGVDGDKSHLSDLVITGNGYGHLDSANTPLNESYAAILNAPHFHLTPVAINTAVQQVPGSEDCGLHAAINICLLEQANRENGGLNKATIEDKLSGNPFDDDQRHVLHQNVDRIRNVFIDSQLIAAGIQPDIREHLVGNAHVDIANRVTPGAMGHDEEFRKKFVSATDGAERDAVVSEAVLIKGINNDFAVRSLAPAHVGVVLAINPIQPQENEALKLIAQVKPFKKTSDTKDIASAILQERDYKDPEHVGYRVSGAHGLAYADPVHIAGKLLVKAGITPTNPVPDTDLQLQFIDKHAKDAGHVFSISSLDDVQRRMFAEGFFNDRTTSAIDVRLADGRKFIDNQEKAAKVELKNVTFDGSKSLDNNAGHILAAFKILNPDVDITKKANKDLVKDIIVPALENGAIKNDLSLFKKLAMDFTAVPADVSDKVKTTVEGQTPANVLQAQEAGIYKDIKDAAYNAPKVAAEHNFRGDITKAAVPSDENHNIDRIYEAFRKLNPSLPGEPTAGAPGVDPRIALKATIKDIILPALKANIIRHDNPEQLQEYADRLSTSKKAVETKITTDTNLQKPLEPKRNKLRLQLGKELFGDKWDAASRTSSVTVLTRSKGGLAHRAALNPEQQKELIDTIVHSKEVEGYLGKLSASDMQALAKHAVLRLKNDGELHNQMGRNSTEAIAESAKNSADDFITKLKSGKSPEEILQDEERKHQHGTEPQNNAVNQGANNTQSGGASGKSGGTPKEGASVAGVAGGAALLVVGAFFWPLAVVGIAVLAYQAYKAIDARSSNSASNNHSTQTQTPAPNQNNSVSEELARVKQKNSELQQENVTIKEESGVMKQQLAQVVAHLNRTGAALTTNDSVPTAPVTNHAVTNARTGNTGQHIG